MKYLVRHNLCNNLCHPSHVNSNTPIIRLDCLLYDIRDLGTGVKSFANFSNGTLVNACEWGIFTGVDGFIVC